MITLIIKAIILAVIIASVSDILMYIEIALCEFLDWLAELFNMVAGVSSISYNGENTIFINVFFSNDSINTIYWGMALIGIAMCLGFAIFSVIKKMFDIGDKHKMSFGQIFGNVLKSILIICSMNAIVSVALIGSNVLLNQMDYLWSHADQISFEYTVYFDEEDYATCARVYNTIAQYSLNPTYNSRYNMNSCFNAIRKDLLSLQNKDKFKYPLDANGENWQSVLQEIVKTQSLEEDIAIDEYNEPMMDAITEAMNILRSDSNSFKPIQSITIKKQAKATTNYYTMGKICMLMGSLDAAYNGYYNENPSFDDPLRRPYLVGERDIFSKWSIERSFNYFIFVWNHVTVLVLSWIFIKQYIGFIFNAASRMFNMIFLYLIAPPFIATMPLDDGGKAKQWTTAFIIQTFSLFGCVLAMRLFMIIVPIIMDSNFVFFSDAKDNMYAKIIVVLGLLFTSKKANGLITGILADNAGMAAITAGDMSSEADSLATTMKDKTLGAAKFAGDQIVGVMHDVGGLFGGGGGDKKKGKGGGGNNKNNRSSSAGQKGTGANGKSEMSNQALGSAEKNRKTRSSSSLTATGKMGQQRNQYRGANSGQKYGKNSANANNSNMNRADIEAANKRIHDQEERDKDPENNSQRFNNHGHNPNDHDNNPGNNHGNNPGNNPSNDPGNNPGNDPNNNSHNQGSQVNRIRGEFNENPRNKRRGSGF